MQWLVGKEQEYPVAPREVATISRNSPCICGSKQRFKRCCGKGIGGPEEMLIIIRYDKKMPSEGRQAGCPILRALREGWGAGSPTEGVASPVYSLLGQNGRCAATSRSAHFSRVLCARSWGLSTSLNLQVHPFPPPSATEPSRANPFGASNIPDADGYAPPPALKSEKATPGRQC